MEYCVGQKLGNYRLVRLLGQGGFGEVYLGEHMYLKTSAAIKLIPAELSKNRLEDFLTEAQTIARLEHPHIVRVLEFGMEERAAFLVMHYAPNGTIRQHHPPGQPLPLARVVQYVKQVASALQYAHDHHIIHRDVKPENMLLGRNNEILLSDFGLAVVGQDSQLTGLPGRAGTTAYTAPEQLQGKPCLASDQYALGVVVYEWLTGTLPFKGSDQEMAVQHVQFLPPTLGERMPDIPPSTEEVVMQTLAKQAQKRFATIREFAHALEQSYYLPSLRSVSVARHLHQNAQAQELAWSSITPELASPSDSLVYRPLSTSAPFLSRDEKQRPSQDACSLPSPSTIQETRPTPEVRSRVKAQTKPQNRSRLSRRTVLRGLLGTGLLTVGGVISWEVFVQQANSSTPAFTSAATTASNTVPNVVHAPTATARPNQTYSPSSSGSPATQPTAPSMPRLRVQFTNLPTQVSRTATVNVGVHTSKPGVTVIFQATFSPSGDTYSSTAAVTDSNGNATLVWAIQEPKAKGAYATVFVMAADQSGQQATTPAEQVQVR